MPESGLGELPPGKQVKQVEDFFQMQPKFSLELEPLALDIAEEIRWRISRSFAEIAICDEERKEVPLRGPVLCTVRMQSSIKGEKLKYFLPGHFFFFLDGAEPSVLVLGPDRLLVEKVCIQTSGVLSVGSEWVGSRPEIDVEWGRSETNSDFVTVLEGSRSYCFMKVGFVDNIYNRLMHRILVSGEMVERRGHAVLRAVFTRDGIQFEANSLILHSRQNVNPTHLDFRY